MIASYKTFQIILRISYIIFIRHVRAIKLTKITYMVNIIKGHTGRWAEVSWSCHLINSMTSCLLRQVIFEWKH